MARSVQEGETESGDQFVAQSIPQGFLVAVVDGLGHGRRAAVVARTAVETVRGHAGESLVSLVERCHKGLRGTRGVVMSLASLSEQGQNLTWLGVGNVRGVLLHAAAGSHRRHRSLLLRGGVVGYRLPPSLRPTTIPVGRGDTLVVATDGVDEVFAEEIAWVDPPGGRIAAGLVEDASDRESPGAATQLRRRVNALERNARRSSLEPPAVSVLEDPVQTVADQILTRYGSGADDALVLVVRFLGSSGAVPETG
jgi:hypothetical protein